MVVAHVLSSLQIGGGERMAVRAGVVSLAQLSQHGQQGLALQGVDLVLLGHDSTLQVVHGSIHEEATVRAVRGLVRAIRNRRR